MSGQDFNKRGFLGVYKIENGAEVYVNGGANYPAVSSEKIYSGMALSPDCRTLYYTNTEFVAIDLPSKTTSKFSMGDGYYLVLGHFGGNLVVLKQCTMIDPEPCSEHLKLLDPNSRTWKYVGRELHRTGSPRYEFTFLPDVKRILATEEDGSGRGYLFSLDDLSTVAEFDLSSYLDVKDHTSGRINISTLGATMSLRNGNVVTVFSLVDMKPVATVTLPGQPFQLEQDGRYLLYSAKGNKTGAVSLLDGKTIWSGHGSGFPVSHIFSDKYFMHHDYKSNGDDYLAIRSIFDGRELFEIVGKFPQIFEVDRGTSIISETDIWGRPSVRLLRDLVQ